MALFVEKTATGFNIDQKAPTRAYFLYLELAYHVYLFVELYKVQNEYCRQLKTLISMAYGFFHVKLTETFKNPLKSKC
jgi:hypothetical protein